MARFLESLFVGTSIFFYNNLLIFLISSGLCISLKKYATENPWTRIAEKILQNMEGGGLTVLMSLVSKKIGVARRRQSFIFIPAKWIKWENIAACSSVRRSI